MNHNKIQHSFLPGEEWIYYKVYSGPRTLEGILINEINSLVDDFLYKGLIDSFFFIRYFDPEYHLRIRFHLKDQSHVGIVVNRFNLEMSKLIVTGIVNNISIDSYKREVDRYGSYTIDLIENLFYHDSVFIISTLKETTSTEFWITSMLFLDRLLDDFGFSIMKKLHVCEITIKSFSEEFSLKKEQRIILDRKYRYYYKNIHAAFDSQDDYKNLNDTIERMNPIIKRIKTVIYEENEVSEIGLVGSIIHMHFNRMFSTQARAYEFVVYYFLFKWVKSQKARLTKIKL